jgi:hypothetical protein
MKYYFKYQQCGKEKEKPAKTVLIQMATMHSKLGISLLHFAHTLTGVYSSLNCQKCYKVQLTSIIL